MKSSIYNISSLIIGFIVLWLSSKKTVTYATQTAHIFGISKLFIGFVLLALSTSIPELFVALQSILAHTPQLSVGDIIGSIFADIAVALGVSALFIGPISMSKVNYFDQLIMFIASALIMALIFIYGLVTPLIGIMLLGLYGISIVWLWKRSNNSSKEAEYEFLAKKYSSTLIYLGIYLFFVILSSKLCVTHAAQLAYHLGLPLEVIGVSIVALGTSLPEISLNIQAVRSKHYALALGNSLGSVFNLTTLILGFLALFSSQPLSLQTVHSIVPWLGASYLLMGYHLFFGKKITRISGFFLLTLYISFMVYQMLYHTS